MELRNDALARASLWHKLDRLVEDADLRSNPKGAGTFANGDHAVCKFLPKATSGTTSKFFCVFEDGEVLKVKYGRNPEIHTEVAATRLLHALGAGADRMYLVKKLRCFGCPKNPQAMLSCLSSPSEVVRKRCEPRYGSTTANGAFAVRVNYGSYVDFGPVAIERRAEGQEIREADISESGRRLLAGRLGRLTAGQVRDLFEGSGFAEARAASPPSRDVDQWVTAFQDKVRQITGRPPCPTG